jgi:hypothetical protein
MSSPLGGGHPGTGGTALQHRSWLVLGRPAAHSRYQHRLSCYRKTRRKQGVVMAAAGLSAPVMVNACTGKVGSLMPHTLSKLDFLSCSFVKDNKASTNAHRCSCAVQLEELH